MTLHGICCGWCVIVQWSRLVNYCVAEPVNVLISWYPIQSNSNQLYIRSSQNTKLPDIHASQNTKITGYRIQSKHLNTEYPSQNTKITEYSIQSNSNPTVYQVQSKHKITGYPIESQHWITGYLSQSKHQKITGSSIQSNPNHANSCQIQSEH